MERRTIYCRLISIISIIIFGYTYSFAACPDPDTVTTVPKLVDVEVKAKTSLDSDTGIYSYSYSIKNGSESTGCIWWLEIDIRKPKGGIELPKEGLTNHRFASLDAPDKRSPPMIPVTFPSLPKMGKIIIWSGGITVYGTAHWNSERYIYQIMPGDVIRGLVMTSYGLPGIRDFKVKPKYLAEDEDIYKMGVSKEEYIADAWKYLNAFYESLAWKGKTIGPTAPPADFKPISFLDYIISLKHEAFNLGWVVQGRGDDKGKKENEEKGIMKSLDEKLNKAKERLELGDTSGAKEKLKSFIHEVEGLYKKEDREEEKEKDKKEKEGHEHITSEAYALLKYNAQYLIDQLEGGKKDKKEK